MLPKIIGTLLILSIIGFLFYDWLTMPVCDICQERLYHKPTEVSSLDRTKHYKLCDRCISMLDFEAAKVFKNKWCVERRMYTSILVDERMEGK